MQIIVMIVSVDGNVFSGKTTLLENISKRVGGNNIYEYSQYLKQIVEITIPEHHNSIHTHQIYLGLDKARKIDLKNGINFLDRSFVSLSAHIYALFKKIKVDLRDEHLHLLNLAFKKNNILIPDRYIFLNSDYKICLERYLKDKLGENKKNTDSLFLDGEYFLSIKIFNKKWQELIGQKGITINNNSDIGRLTEFILRDNDQNSPTIDIMKTLALCYRILS